MTIEKRQFSKLLPVRRRQPTIQNADRLTAEKRRGGSPVYDTAYGPCATVCTHESLETSVILRLAQNDAYKAIWLRELSNVLFT